MLQRYTLLVLASLLLKVGANGDSAGPDGLFGAVWRLCHQLDRLVSRAAIPAWCCGTKDVAGEACGSVASFRRRAHSQRVKHGAVTASWAAVRTCCGVGAWLWAPITALELAWSVPYGPCPLLAVTTGVPTTGSGLNGFSSAAAQSTDRQSRSSECVFRDILDSCLGMSTAT